ncbi:TetR/AcrR family transcriptional regulator [Xanthomonas campestris pv. phormiicola]|nr:TetR/AcrR family transcriptional regulator [Xanthomonas campestris pv. phormiicola]UYC16355.1 TetR/AcrR family transcriptional regulator [Xanthomonas campestris pv. phormiicola]
MTVHPISAAPAEEAATAHADAQRQRILDAAQRCFIARGFHAGSINDIATEADISQGLMYRYFANKRALILALIERQLDHDTHAIAQMPAVPDVAEGLLRCYQVWARGETLETGGNAIANVALYAEITAEAQRDPVVAEVLRRHDRQTNNAIADWLRKHDSARGHSSDEAEIARRILLFRMLVEGLAMRSARDPDLSAERLRPVLISAISSLVDG